MAKCIPTCVMCSKFGTMKCHKVARIKRIEQLVQGAYPWDCLYNSLDRRKSKHGIQLETYPFNRTDLYDTKCSANGTSCPLKSTDQWYYKRKAHYDERETAGSCPMVDKSNNSGQFCQCALRHIRLTLNEYRLREHGDDYALNCHDYMNAYSSLEDIQTDFELDPKWKEKLRSVSLKTLTTHWVWDTVSIKGLPTFEKYCRKKGFTTFGDLIDGFNLDEYRKMIIKLTDKARNRCLAGLSEGFKVRDGWKYEREDAETVNGKIPWICKYGSTIVFEDNKFVIAEPDFAFALEVYKNECDEARKRDQEFWMEQSRKHEEQLARRRAKAKAKREAAAKAKLEAEQKASAKEAENKKTFDDFKGGKFLVARSMPIPLDGMRIIRTPDFGYLNVIVRNGIRRGTHFQYLNTVMDPSVTDPSTGKSPLSIVTECIIYIPPFGRQVLRILIDEARLKRYIGSGAITLATDDEANEMTQWLKEHHGEKG